MDTLASCLSPPVNSARGSVASADGFCLLDDGISDGIDGEDGNNEDAAINNDAKNEVRTELDLESQDNIKTVMPFCLFEIQVQ